MHSSKNFLVNKLLCLGRCIIKGFESWPADRTSQGKAPRWLQCEIMGASAHESGEQPMRCPSSKSGEGV